jgi:sugar phosphate isomerase/epimerase
MTATAAGAATLAFAGRRAWANPLGLPLGLELYSVRDQMKVDFPGTLAAVKSAGFTEVEAAALPNLPAQEVRSGLDKAGLRCVSAHVGMGDLQGKFEQTVAYYKTLGVEYLLCASPGFRNPGTGKRTMTLDDWHYSAEQFNLFGEKLAKVGIKFAYHNHTGEFQSTEGKVPYEELLRLTDPRKVSFEMDCGWVVVAGFDPAKLLEAHPHRIVMLHVKDFKAPEGGAKEGKVTELGRGVINYKPILAAARRTQHITHAFVEQEAFDVPWQESLKIDADYMKAL